MSSIYTFFNSEIPEYFKEIHFPAELSNINTRSSFQRLKQPLRKPKIEDLNSASYSGPSLCDKLSIEIKRSGSSNSFKHNAENYYLTKMEHTGFVNIFLISGDDNIYVLIILFTNISIKVSRFFVNLRKLFHHFNNTFLH